MAYKVTQDYLNKIYSEDNDNDLYIEYGGEVITNGSLLTSYLRLEKRLLDKGTKVFSLDNFVTQTAELEIHDFLPDDLNKEFYLKLGAKVNDQYEYVPLGYFKIQDAPTTIGGKTTYKLKDRSINFDFNYDASGVINANGGTATLLQILQDICKQAKVELATPDFMKKDKLIGVYDNTITARVYVSYIAEISGCIATIGRDGKLYLIPIKKENNDAMEIPEYFYNDKFTKGDSYEISKVLFEGATVFSAGDDSADTLFINISNLFISDEQDIIDIYEQVKGFKIYNVETSDMTGTPAYDPYDFVKFNITDDEGTIIDSFITLAQYSFEFKGINKQSFATNIDRLAKKQNSSLRSNGARIKRLKQDIDVINGVLNIISEEMGQISNNFAIKKSISGNPVEIKDAGNYPLELLQIFGKTESGISVVGKEDIDEDHKGHWLVIKSQNMLDTQNEDYAESFGYIDMNVYDDNQFIIGHYEISEKDIFDNGTLTKSDGTEYNLTYEKLSLFEGYNYITLNDDLLPTMYIEYLTNSDLNSQFATKSELQIESDRVTTTVMESIEPIVDDKLISVNESINDAVTQLQSKIDQTASEVNFKFETVTTNIENINDTIIENQNKLESYIQFTNDPSIILGRSDSDSKVSISNDNVSIINGGKVVSHWEGNKFFVDELHLGNFAFIPRQNGNLSFRKVK